jgi:hypothetical protein
MDGVCRGVLQSDITDEREVERDDSKNGGSGNLKMNNEQLQEESVKEILNKWLQSKGWKTELARGHQHGIDINATTDDKRWVIEVKGCGSRNAMRVNYFLAILGEILQRMDDPNARYSIALPNIQQFRKL